MKTTRCLFLLISLGVMTQGLSVAQPSTPAAPKASSPATAAAGKEPGNQARSPSEQSNAGSSGKKQEGGAVNPNAAGHSAARPDDNRAAAGNNSSRRLDARQPENVPHELKPPPNNRLPLLEKPAGNGRNRTTVGNATGLPQAALNKSASAANNGLMVKKAGNFSSQPVSPSAGRLPTSPSIKAVQGRVPGLAAIGGAAKPTAGNTAAISGTVTKYRP